MENLSNHRKNIITSVAKGEVWLAYDEKSDKVRPFLIMSDELSGIDIDISVAPTTTKNRRNQYDVEIEHWQEAGLLIASIARCSKITIISYLHLVRKIGTLVDSDMKRINEAIRKYFAL